LHHSPATALSNTTESVFESGVPDLDPTHYGEADRPK
jgi:hypothetical protein